MSTITDSLKNFYKKLGGSLSNLGPNSTSADIVDAMAEVYTDKEGTYVEVTEAVTEGTKIATIKTNNENHDIYAPVELPTVTSADEGRILTVDGNGNWSADDLPEEETIFLVKGMAEFITQNSYEVTFDGYNSISDLYTAINNEYINHRLPMLKIDSEDASTEGAVAGIYTLEHVFNHASGESPTFSYSFVHINNIGGDLAGIFTLSNCLRIVINNKINTDSVSIGFSSFYTLPKLDGSSGVKNKIVKTNTYGWNYALADETKELPTASAANNGKVLGIVNAKWAIMDSPTELPAVTSSDEGKVLSVDSNGGWIADDVPSELPAVTSADEGKVLTVDGNGDWTADDVPSELPAVTSADEGKIMSVDSTGAWSIKPGTFVVDAGYWPTNQIVIRGYESWGAAAVAIRKALRNGLDVVLHSSMEGDSDPIFRCQGYNSDGGKITFVNFNVSDPTKLVVQYFYLPATTETANKISYTVKNINYDS